MQCQQKTCPQLVIWGTWNCFYRQIAQWSSSFEWYTICRTLFHSWRRIPLKFPRPSNYSEDNSAVLTVNLSRPMKQSLLFYGPYLSDTKCTWLLCSEFFGVCTESRSRDRLWSWTRVRRKGLDLPFSVPFVFYYLHHFSSLTKRIIYFIKDVLC